MGERADKIAKTPEVKQSNSNSRVRRTERLQSMDTPVDRILFLQRTAGNQAVSRLMKSRALQAKLRIGQPGDVYEQEADRVADAVMRMPEPGVQREVEPEEEEKEEILQTKPLVDQITPVVQRHVEEEEMLQAKSKEDAASEVSNNFESQINAIKGGGQPLAESERAFFEPRFEADFSQVKVHTGSQADESTRAVNALAYTVGRDIVFGAGQYAPHLEAGRRLIGHELVHVLQQESATSPNGPVPLRASDLSDQCEQTADQAADATLFGDRQQISLSSIVSRANAPRLWRQRPAGSDAPSSQKIWYVLKPPDAICQGESSHYCWAASGASYLRVTGINPQATRNMLIVRFGACLGEGGDLPEADMSDVFQELGANVNRVEGSFDYDYVRRELAHNGHFLLFTSGFIGHMLVVYGVGVDPSGKPSKGYFSVFDPATCTHRNLSFSEVVPVYIGRRTHPGPIARCRE